MLDYPPDTKDLMFYIFLHQAYLECPNLYVSPEHVFVLIGRYGSHIQVLKVCSTICPGKKAQYSRFFGTKHIWNAPTYAFHRNRFWVKLVAMAQSSRSSK